MKLAVTLGLLIGGTVGGVIGGGLDHGNMIGAWSIILSTVGSLAGIWAGYKVAKYYF
jgi:uncharacterized protein YcfJ